MAVAVFDADVLIAYLGRDARGHDGVRLESFDEKVVTAFAALHPVTPDLR